MLRSAVFRALVDSVLARPSSVVKYGPGGAGFSAIGLLVALTIASVFGVFLWRHYVDTPNVGEADPGRAQVRVLANALEAYRRDVGNYPTTEQGLAALTNSPAGQTGWKGPYLNHATPVDPWGRPYQYRNPGVYGVVDIYSLGSDGRPGQTPALVHASPNPLKAEHAPATLTAPPGSSGASGTTLPEGVRSGINPAPVDARQAQSYRPKPFTGPSARRGQRVSPPLEEVYEPPQ